MSGVTQFRDLQSENTAVKLGFRQNMSIETSVTFDNLSNTESFSVEPGPSVHHHSCRGRKPTYAGASSSTSPYAP